jgi:hypothetical protein
MREKMKKRITYTVEYFFVCSEKMYRTFADLHSAEMFMEGLSELPSIDHFQLIIEE